MARGGGEHLASLATLMRVPLEHQPDFFAMAQERYVSLVGSGEADPVVVEEALRGAIAVYPILAENK
jgi:hypothetical protein